MRTSITLTNFSWPKGNDFAQELGEVLQFADRSGIDTVFVSDHLMQAEPGTQPTDPMLEAYTTLGFIAAHTERIRLGTMVTAATFRPPALLVKAVTTLDVLSHGRAWFGIGAGYHRDEADWFGLPLPPTAERFEWLEDTLRLATQMWKGDHSAFTGKNVRAQRPISQPAPLAAPHPPILVGGTGEKKTLRLVARYGDACNLHDIPDGGAAIRRKLSVLADHCRAEGRHFDDIEKTVSTRLTAGQPASAFVEHAKELAALGIDHLVVLTQGPWTAASLKILADTLKPIAEISPTKISNVGDLAEVDISEAPSA
jgi:F420-dependent oxidoreductase-like protein